MLSHTYPPATRGKLIVWGLLASYPFGGMTWQVLHYVAGLRRLGYDVWYVEDSDRFLLNANDFSLTGEFRANIEYLSRHMEAIGLGDRWVFRPPRTRTKPVTWRFQTAPRRGRAGRRSQARP